INEDANENNNKNDNGNRNDNDNDNDNDNELGNDDDEIRIYKNTHQSNSKKDGTATDDNKDGFVQIKWVSSPLNDFIVDSVIALIVSVDCDSNGGVAQSMMQKCKEKDGIGLEEESGMMPTLWQNNVHLITPPTTTTNIIDPIETNPQLVVKEEHEKQSDSQTGHSYNSSQQTQHKQTDSVNYSCPDDVVYKIVLNGKYAVITFRYNVLPVYDYKDKYQNRKATVQRIYFFFCTHFKVESDDLSLKQRIEGILRHVDSALYPVHKDFDCQKDFNLPKMPTLDPPKPLSNFLDKNQQKKTKAQKKYIRSRDKINNHRRADKINNIIIIKTNCSVTKLIFINFCHKNSINNPQPNKKSKIFPTNNSNANNKKKECSAMPY
ncbi:hypothetical protein RFI_07659, partial [Reticulomyxa filosa]